MASSAQATQRRHRVRRSFLARWKLAAGCVDCGYAKHSVSLDFDHVIGKKEFGVGGPGIGRSWKRLLAEIDKCVVRCSNCHRVATHGRA